MGWFGGHKGQAGVKNFDSDLRYDIYCSPAPGEHVVLKDVAVQGVRTWEKIEDEGLVTNTFLEVTNSRGEIVWVDETSVFIFCEAGTRPDISKVSW